MVHTQISIDFEISVDFESLAVGNRALEIIKGIGEKPVRRVFFTRSTISFQGNDHAEE